MSRDERDETVCLAQNLAKNAGYSVFPCGENKAPARPRSQGGAGFRDATVDPDRIAWLWQNWPGARIGIATGAASGVSVLDVDRKHDAACAWWKANEHRMPLTRVYRTPGGGIHLYFRHWPGLRSSAGRIAGRDCAGIDCRADGGYIMFHFAAGLQCLDNSPLVDWPAWLIQDLQQTKQSQQVHRAASISRTLHRDNLTAGIINAVKTAKEGFRNKTLFWASCRLAERGIGRAEAEAMLLPVALAAGLEKQNAISTIRSGLRQGGR